MASEPMPKPVFCCGAATPWEIPTPPFIDPLRSHHESIFSSFVAYAIRSGRTLDNPTANSFAPTSPPSSPPPTVPSQEPKILTPPTSPSNCNSQSITAPQSGRKPSTGSITHQTPYCIHLETRNDFGPVISHRYFAPSLEIQGEWIEVEQKEFWEAPDSYRVVGAKKTFKCSGHGFFFKVLFKPNLSHRAWVSAVPEGGVIN